MEPNLPLRDIHLPEPVGWWPPAPGWWLLAVGVPALLACAVWLWHRLRRPTPKKLALREWAAIAHGAMPPQEKLRRLAVLLRRAALSAYPREEVAGLAGEQWLAFLDRNLGGQDFSAGPGRLLAEAPYRREAPGEVDALLALCRAWLKRLPEPGRAGPRRRWLARKERP
jgi:hypothetical protein